MNEEKLVYCVIDEYLELGIVNVEAYDTMDKAEKRFNELVEKYVLWYGLDRSKIEERTTPNIIESYYKGVFFLTATIVPVQ